MSTATAFLVGFVLLIGNAFFVGAEFALMSVRRTKLEPKAAAGSRMARSALSATEDLSSVIAAAQFGITVCSLGLGAVAEPSLAHVLEPLFHDIGVPDAWLHPSAFTLAMAIVVYLHVVLGEMVPKNLAIAGPERAALVFGPPMMFLVTLFKPVVVGLNLAADAFLRMLRIEPKSEVASTFTHEEVEALVDESRAEGLLEDAEYERLSGALDFSNSTVRDVLLPVSSLQVVSRGARATEVEEVCAATGYSRFPVVAPDGELQGYLHIKDVLDTDTGRHRVVEDKWIRPFANVRETDTLVSALQLLQAKGSHMARVVDDSGAVVGVATLEDVIEELVGEIRDAAHH